MDRLGENLDNTFFGSIRKKVSTIFGNCDKDKRTPMEECQKMLNLLRQGKIKGRVFILKTQNIIDQVEPEVAEELRDFLDRSRALLRNKVYYVVHIGREDGTVRLDKYA